jgi:hypothetical protein
MFAEFVENLGKLVVYLSAETHLSNQLIPGPHLQLGEPEQQLKSGPEFWYTTYSSEAASASSLIKDLD